MEDATESDIREFCTRKNKQQPGKERLLWIDFFNDRQHTPDVTLTGELPEACFPYQVASYRYNPFNDNELLTFDLPGPHADLGEEDAIAKMIQDLKVIPALKPVDVYGSFADRGFTVEKDFSDPQQPIWRCTEDTQQHKMMVEVFGRTATDVTLVRGTYHNYSSKDADEAADFFGYLASIPYDGSQPANAKSWVLKNIGTNAKTTIGGVAFELVVNPDAPRFRMLIIQLATPTLPERKQYEIRTWTDITGQFTVEAQFVRLSMGEVTLQKTDGSTVKLPMERLSKADQEWIREQFKR